MTPRALCVAPQVFCQNGLDPDRFVHLDFLDFAMAVLSEQVDVGNIHAIRVPPAPPHQLASPIGPRARA